MNDAQIVDEVTKIRARNNELWMKLLKIALEHAPSQTKQVLNDISLNDTKITRLINNLGSQ